MTTAAEIRDYAIALIEALTPPIHADVRFVPHRYELDGDLAAWAVERPTGSLRRFSVRDARASRTPDVADAVLEACFVDLEVLVAYPHTSRLGPQNALDRDDAIRRDRHLIEQTIGLNGGANFTSPAAEWISGRSARAAGAGVDFLVIRQTMRYRRAAVLW